MNRAGSWSDKNRVQDWSHPPEPSPPQAESWTAPTARQGACATVCEVDRARNRAASCIRARTSDPDIDGAPSCDRRQPLTSKCPCEVRRGKGNFYGNSDVENFFTSPRAEMAWRRPWQILHEVELVIFDYFNGFSNLRRKHTALGWTSAVAFDQRAA